MARVLVGLSLRRLVLFLPPVSVKYNTNRPRFYGTRLEEVGRFERPKTQGKYEAGQLFLHRVFGYRGVILFPWVAKLYDRDAQNKSTDEKNVTDENSSEQVSLLSKEEEDTFSSGTGRELKGELIIYYQTLIDRRDCPYIRAQPEAVTFFGNQKDTYELYAFPGLDYVSHEDVLPYTTSDDQPIQHELFESFLIHDPDRVPSFAASEALRMWHDKNHKRLELSHVYRETTENIRISVIPFYMGSRSIQQTQSFWWRYCIRLENLGVDTVQLRERHWMICSLSGTLEKVSGRGVIGQEPMLSPRQPAFQYSSYVELHAPSGDMWGKYRMERADGTMFDIKIPEFLLESKEEEPHPIVGN